MKVINGLATTKYTVIHCEDKEYWDYNAPHTFIVSSMEDGKTLTRVDFQKGPIKERGVNGVANEDLIVMVLERLYNFQKTKFACKENEIAITKLEESLMWLRKRTQDREARNVEGTSNV